MVFRDGGDFAPFPSDPKPPAKSAGQHAEKWISEWAEPETLFSDAKLREFLGQCEHPKLSQCGECGGTGQVAHNCDCDLCEADYEDCDCDGKPVESKPNKRAVRILGTALDANLFAYLIDRAPVAAEYRIGWIDDKVLRISCDKWRALVCSLGNVDDEKDLPNLERSSLVTKGKGKR